MTIVGKTLLSTLRLVSFPYPPPSLFSILCAPSVVISLRSLTCCILDNFLCFVWQIFTGCGDGRREHEWLPVLSFLEGSFFPCRIVFTVSGCGRTRPALHYISLPWPDIQCSPLNLALFCNRCSRLFPLPLSLRSSFLPWSVLSSPCVLACEGGVEIHVLRHREQKGDKPGQRSKHMAVLAFYPSLRCANGPIFPPPPIIHPSYPILLRFSFSFFCHISQIRDDTLLAFGSCSHEFAAGSYKSHTLQNSIANLHQLTA